MTKFFDYVLSFYGPEGLYPMGVTIEQIIQATEIYLLSGAEFQGDSVDRENVRDIMIKRFNLKFPA